MLFFIKNDAILYIYLKKIKSHMMSLHQSIFFRCTLRFFHTFMSRQVKFL